MNEYIHIYVYIYTYIYIYAMHVSGHLQVLQCFLPVTLAWTMHSLAGSELGCGSEVLDSDLTWKMVEDCGKWEAHRSHCCPASSCRTLRAFRATGLRLRCREVGENLIFDLLQSHQISWHSGNLWMQHICSESFWFMSHIPHGLSISKSSKIFLSLWSTCSTPDITAVLLLAQNLGIDPVEGRNPDACREERGERNIAKWWEVDIRWC